MANQQWVVVSAPCNLPWSGHGTEKKKKELTEKPSRSDSACCLFVPACFAEAIYAMWHREWGSFPQVSPFKRFIKRRLSFTAPSLYLEVWILVVIFLNWVQILRWKKINRNWTENVLRHMVWIDEIHIFALRLETNIRCGILAVMNSTLATARGKRLNDEA